jgi:endonuclease/exonuclease/phosphatase (EEP) superfamily protein YafD
MGLHLGGARAQTRGAARLTVLQLNMSFGQGGLEPLLALVHETRPDVVALEAVGENFRSLRAGLPDYIFYRDGELALGSRLPLDAFAPDPTIVTHGATHQAKYIRGRVTTAAGPVRVYAVHPISPHPSFDKIRASGRTEDLWTGEIVEQEARRAMAETTVVRLAQLGAVAEDARSSPDPVLIVGDTNLPELSWAFAGLFGGYHDAFAETGRGFGYTYPADRPSLDPWMRIDRILAGTGLRVLTASAPARRIYKHLPLVAEVEVLPGAPR